MSLRIEARNSCVFTMHHQPSSQSRIKPPQSQWPRRSHRQPCQAEFGIGSRGLVGGDILDTTKYEALHSMCRLSFGAIVDMDTYGEGAEMREPWVDLDGRQRMRVSESYECPSVSDGSPFKVLVGQQIHEKSFTAQAESNCWRFETASLVTSGDRPSTLSGSHCFQHSLV